MNISVNRLKLFLLWKQNAKFKLSRKVYKGVNLSSLLKLSALNLMYRTFFIQYRMAIVVNCWHCFCLIISVWGVNVCCYRWHSSPVTKVGLVLPPCTFELVITRFKDYVFFLKSIQTDVYMKYEWNLQYMYVESHL